MIKNWGKKKNLQNISSGTNLLHEIEDFQIF